MQFYYNVSWHIRKSMNPEKAYDLNLPGKTKIKVEPGLW